MYQITLNLANYQVCAGKQGLSQDLSCWSFGQAVSGNPTLWTGKNSRKNFEVFGLVTNLFPTNYSFRARLKCSLLF